MSGLFVAICGPDGTGKSTLSKSLAEGGGFASTQILHWRPNVLPRLGAIVGRPASDGTNPHGEEPYGYTVSLGRLLYYWLDQLVGYVLRIRPLRRSDALVVLERGYWDMAVDPCRYRLGLRPALIAALGRLVPEPDLTFVLVGAPSTIADRTRELSVDETDRQVRRWSELARSRERWHVLDATRSADRILADAAMLVATERRNRAVHA